MISRARSNDQTSRILASDWSAGVTILLMIATITSIAPQWPALSLLSGSIANCRPQSHAFKPLLPCQHNVLTKESLLKILQHQSYVHQEKRIRLSRDCLFKQAHRVYQYIICESQSKPKTQSYFFLKKKNQCFRTIK